VHNGGRREIDEAISFVKNAEAQDRLLRLLQRYLPVVSRFPQSCLADAVAASPIVAGVVLRFWRLLRVFFPLYHTKTDNCHFGFGFHSGDDSRDGVGVEEEGIVVQTDDVVPLRLAHKMVAGSNEPTVLFKPE
jgi:hypothetical protein